MDRKIGFLDIYDIIEQCLDELNFIDNPSLEDILDTEQLVYEYIESRW